MLGSVDALSVSVRSTCGRVLCTVLTVWSGADLTKCRRVLVSGRAMCVKPHAETDFHAGMPCPAAYTHHSEHSTMCIHAHTHTQTHA